MRVRANHIEPRGDQSARVAMSTSSPSSARLAAKQDGAALQLSTRLKKCWEVSLDLSLLPCKLAEVGCTPFNIKSLAISVCLSHTY